MTVVRDWCSWSARSYSWLMSATTIDDWSRLSGRRSWREVRQRGRLHWPRRAEHAAGHRGARRRRPSDQGLRWCSLVLVGQAREARRWIVVLPRRLRWRGCPERCAGLALRRTPTWWRPDCGCRTVISEELGLLALLEGLEVQGRWDREEEGPVPGPLPLAPSIW